MDSRGVSIESAVDEALPHRDEARDVLVTLLAQMLCCERQAAAFGCRIANWHLVHMRQPREESPIEQREGRTPLAAIPERACRRTDVVGKALRPDVEIPYVCRGDEADAGMSAFTRTNDADDVHGEQSGQERRGHPHEYPRRLRNPRKEPDDPAQPPWKPR